jgi:DNA transposition AAA+ family ATPase
MANPFIETREYQRFQEFCDACSHHRYIGICYGPPGVGKTLSARHYTNWDEAESLDLHPHRLTVDRVFASRGVFYTVAVINTPGRIDREIDFLRQALRWVSPDMKKFEDEQDRRLEDARRRETEDLKAYALFESGNSAKSKSFQDFQSRPTYEELSKEGARLRRKLDPTRLIIIDEADRLKMAGLEQLRHIFDGGGIGLVLVGMFGLERRLARYPQLYSRVGFAHEFRALTRGETCQVLHEQLLTSDRPSFPNGWSANDEGTAAIIRITGGNFRLLHRLMSQIGRILEINGLSAITRAVVEAARENLVIGTE